MPVVLVVEPQCFDASKVLEHLGGECMCIPVATPSSAACALHALQFDVVLVVVDKVEALDYAALFSTMRLVAPNARLVCGPAQESEHPARVHVQAAHENDPLRL